MSVYLSDPDVTLYHGDALDVLKTLPDESVDCCITSPPFYGLRDYGVDGQIGLEASPDEWVAQLVAVFSEVRRVLTKRGTLWVECGDSYAANNQGSRKGAAATKGGVHGHAPNSWGGGQQTAIPHPTKPKDLLGQPWLLAFALRADGWWLRQAIIWHKRNAMPESVTDRCTTSHSYVFLLAKSARYYFDAEAISEPAEWARWGDQTTPKHNGTDTAAGWIGPRSKDDLLAERTGRGKQGETAAAAAAGNDASARRYDGFNERWEASGRKGNGQRERSGDMRGFDEREDRADGRKNARSVWDIPTQGFSEAHFATFPEELVRRALLAGCPEQVCRECGKARERVVEVEFHQRQINNGKSRGHAAGPAKLPSGTTRVRTSGFTDCGHDAYRPGIVLDPFMGSGTVALVARKQNRRAIGIELNADYCEMAARRLAQQSLFAVSA